MKPDHSSISERKPQHILVTGGGGFLGGAIVRRLIDRGDRVTSFSRRRYSGIAALGADQVSGDLSDKNAVGRACRNVDAVFHVAAKTGVWGPYHEYYTTNVTGTLNVIAACRNARVPRLVYTGSPSAVFDGSDMEGVNEAAAPYPAAYHAPYPKTKALAEQHVRQASGKDLKTIVLRPHLIWGPGDTSLVPRILARHKRLRRIGDGLNRVDTVYVDNAAEAHLLAADRLLEAPELSGNVYFISQGEPIPLWEMIDRILAAGGLPPVKKRISFRAAWLAGAVLEAVYRLFSISAEPQMTRFVARELATAHWFDIRAARNDLGYVPGISTEEGLKRLEAWLQKQNTR